MGKVTKNSYKRDELTDTLLKLNSSLGASKVTLNNIEKLRDEKNLVCGYRAANGNTWWPSVYLI